MENNVFLFNITLIIIIISSLELTKSAPQDALVTKLPGFSGKFPSKHYSGFMAIGGKNGKKLFYYFVVSERKPVEDPVDLWLNGGPGCSSLDGFVYEHGPFNFEKGKARGSMPKLHLNPFSWSKASNIIYLDSPAGVGFSYSGNVSDYVTGVKQTAYDSHTFLLEWFAFYPEFLSNPFFIAGESYGGVYVPTLASEVVKGIDADVKPLINFKGYMVGNGVTDRHFDRNALVPFVHGMGLISEDLYQAVVVECKGKYYDTDTTSCNKKLERIYYDLDNLNIYNILEQCYHSPGSNTTSGTTRLPQSFMQLGETESPLPVRTRMFGRAWPLRDLIGDGIVPTWQQLLSTEVPCTDDEVASTWLNRGEVRKAIHAEQESVAGKWELCTSRITFWNDVGPSFLDYHKNLTSRGIRSLIYSGDHDMCVPFTGSEAWTRSLGYKIVDEWRPWMVNDQVGGYIQGYDKNLTFLTVKGCGHTVPEYKPREALAFYSRWLDGKDI